MEEGSTMLPDRIELDQPLPGPGPIAYALEAAASDQFGTAAEVTRLHRILYPVFRVEYRYEVDSSVPFSAETKTGVTAVDGLWADNHAPLQQYSENLTSTTFAAVDPYDFGQGESGLGRTVLFDFQVASTQPERLLTDRIEEAGESAEFESQLIETFGLPEEFDTSGFEGVESVDRIYLPFWLGELYHPTERDRIVAVRTLGDARSAPVDAHGWLSAFLSDDRTRPAAYAHEALRETETNPADTDETAASAPTAETDDSRSTASSDHTSEEPVQPEDADLDAEMLVQTTAERTFADVGGMEGLKETLHRSVIDPVRQPEQFQEYGLDPVSGVLFHGPPGCGKTYIAAAISGELDWSFVDVTPADLSSKYMGKPAENVQDVFEIAAANSPCVLFIDEIDAVASAREDQENTSERGMTNQLLTELETVPDDVLVLAATNLLEEVDDAILRTGRFDERIEVPPPDAEARREILHVHLEGRPQVDGLSLDSVVATTAGYAASDLTYIATDAARRALRSDEEITDEHLLAAVDSVESSVPDWAGSALGDGKTVTQPDDVDLSARSLVTPSVEKTFSDVGGMADLKTRLEETVIEPAENESRYEEYGLDSTSGILLHGPPGCGKTYITEALAGELDWAFLPITPADLTSKWMGKPAQNVADLFEIARANEPCMVFLDEIDAVAGARGGTATTSQRQLVNQLLTELETIEDSDVVVVGATNLVEEVDDAILRSGRFDERIEVPPPDATARREILKVHLANRPVDDVDWETVAAETEGYAASDLALLADNAARQALQADSAVRTEHLREAVAETASSLDGWNTEGVSEETPETRWYR
jgi:SpoVK/Ycf46/Vps4 family AAA+-type ATPase